MPITAAAVSMSRTAMKLRPTALRTMLRASRVSASTTREGQQVTAGGAAEILAGDRSGGALMTPEGLWFENQPNLVKAHSTKNCAARVVTIR